MEMLLMGACISLFAFAVMAGVFSAATRTEETKPESGADLSPERPPVLAQAPSRFFTETVSRPPAPGALIPIEALLLQIESHVRLEQAAAESFTESPTYALLHGRTASPLIQ
jgi:hypothetical protein